MRTAPQRAGVGVVVRPDCFGSGGDSMNQRVPLAICRQCATVSSCSLLRLARFVEGPLDEFLGEFLNRKFPYGRSTDRWARGSRA